MFKIMRRLVNARKRKFFLYSIFLWMIYCYFVLSLKSSKKYCMGSMSYIKKLQCYNSIANDALPSAEDPNFSPGDKAIFFLDTSCRGSINSRQACAVESAARLHPNRQINLMFTSPVTERMLQSKILAKLSEFKNVKYARVHIKHYGENTVVQPILSCLKKSSYPMEHAADILRIVTLHKFGGIYLDTDMLLVQNLDSLPENWIASQFYSDIASGAMAFTKNTTGASLTKLILMEMRATYDPSSWSHNGPLAIERVLKRLCPNALKKSGSCLGVKILPQFSFYPIHYSLSHLYFRRGSIDDYFKLGYEPYMHHMWNFLTSGLRIHKDSPYNKLARTFCPAIYNLYGENFGNDELINNTLEIKKLIWKEYKQLNRKLRKNKDRNWFLNH